MRQRPHTHPCHDCKVKVECPGEWEQNHDGWPEVVCLEYERAGFDFVCDVCEEKRKAEWAAEQAAG